MELRNSSQVHRNNVRVLLRAIKCHGPISKRDLQKVTGLSWGTVSSISGLLIDNGYVVALGKQTTAVGRKPETLDINAADRYAVGVDFNCYGLTVVVTDLKGTLVSTQRCAFARRESACVIDTLYRILDDIVCNRFADKELIGIGFAVQGIVNAEKGISVLVTKIRGWRDIPLRDMVYARYGCPTVVMHDTDCLMKAECTVGSPSMGAAANAVLLRMDHAVGLGMSVMIGGRLYLGSRGKAGEIGRTLVYSTDENRQGFLEEYISEDWLLNSYRLHDPQAEEVTCEALVAAARMGDPFCRGLFDRMGHYLGTALVNCVNVLNPELVMLYGTLTNYEDLFLQRTRDILQRCSYERDTRLEVSRLGSDAAAQGAALVMADEHIDAMRLAAENMPAAEPVGDAAIGTE